MALVMVIGVTAVLAIMVTTALATGVFSQRNARESQDSSAAIAAAYAGVEEYQSRLANENTYFRFGNPASAFSSGSSVVLPTGAATNPAFGVGASGTWARVAGSDGRAEFRYEVDNASYMSSGTLRVRSTGRVGGETRSIVADLRQTAFIDYLYFSDFEIMDPDISGAPLTCVRYHHAGRASTCQSIQFGGRDVLNGKVHSNDTMRICDATFNGTVTTASPASGGLSYLRQSSNGASCSGQVFNAGAPRTVEAITMPETNSELMREVRTDLPFDVPRPGCLYTGPTRIVLNNNGTMTVRSPWTKRTRIAGSPATSGSTPAECGNPSTVAGGLGHSGGATVPVPENNVVYVQNVPSLSSNPNFTATTTRPSGLTCVGASGQANGNGIGYPRASEVAPSSSSYGCRNGDVFIEGTMDGALTIAAENYVYVTGDIRYRDASDDVLGLIGNNAVWVWNPVDSSNRTQLTDSGRRIDAALMSVSHTVQVQNYNKGSFRGILTINGSLIQKFRGTVGQTGSSTTGYTKNYLYDQRYLYLAPPKFLNPVATTYGVTTWIEVDPAFDGSGV